MNPVPSRTVKAWVVVNRGGHPFVVTCALLRRDAIAAYNQHNWSSYERDRRKFGVQVVRCFITTEPAAPATMEDK